MFISTSRAGEALIPIAIKFSSEIGVPLLERKGQPLPSEVPVLVVEKTGLALSYGVPRSVQRWHPGFLKNRCKQWRTEPLFRAIWSIYCGNLLPININECREALKDVYVIDGTLGLGHDSLFLAWLGVQVKAYESYPLIYLFSREGMRQFSPKLCQRITFHFADSRSLIYPTDQSQPLIYIDPMFSREMKSMNLAMQRSLLGQQKLTSQMIVNFASISTRGVLYKRPSKTRPISLPTCFITKDFASNRVIISHSYKSSQ